MARAQRRHTNHTNHREHDHEGEIESGTHEAMERTGREARHMQRTALDAFDMLNGPMTRLMDQNWSMFQKMMQAMQTESLKFLNRRLEHTGHVIENSREHEGMSGLLALQQEWMVEFARDCADQTKRMAELMRDFAEDGASNLSSATSEIAERSHNETENEHRRATA